MKVKLMMTAVVLGLCASASVFAADQTLLEKHGGTWPKAVDGFVTKTQCLQCHGSYEALAEKTKDYVVNPHYSHLGEVNCEECHLPNQSKAELMCNSCHKFEIKRAK